MAQRHHTGSIVAQFGRFVRLFAVWQRMFYALRKAGVNAGEVLSVGNYKFSCGNYPVVLSKLNEIHSARQILTIKSN